MRLCLVAISLLLLGACSMGAKHTCDSYCLSQGGTCDRIEYGRSEFNTETGQAKKRPTVFHCKFFN